MNAAGQIIGWNEEAIRINGYWAREIVGKHFSVLYPPEDIREGKPRAQLEHAVAEVHWRDEGWRVRKDGTRWATVISTALCDERGCLHGFAIVTRDDKAHKSTVEVLRKARTVFWFRAPSRSPVL